MKILFVDDSTDNLKLYQIYLKKESEFEVIYEASAHKALDIVKNQNIDLIFVDIQMPEMGGIEFRQKVLSETGFKGKLIALTAYSDDVSLNEISKGGFADIVKKPILKNDLIKFIKNIKG